MEGLACGGISCLPAVGKIGNVFLASLAKHGFDDMRGLDFDPSRRRACVDEIERVNELRKMLHPKTNLPAGFFRARLHADLDREVNVIVVGPGYDSYPGAL